MRLRFPLFTLPFVLLTSLAAGAEPPLAEAVATTDVWSEPAVDSATLTNDKRETQLLPREKVLIHASSGPWVRIEAMEQPEYTHHNRWEGYPGWVLKSSLIFPSAKAPHPTQPAEDILYFAKDQIGTPYLWGGMSRQSGFDCSGLVHLAYRRNGTTIPRDAHEQWMKAKPIKRAELKPADLIFSAKKEHPDKIVHVALYAGEERIIEAPQTGMTVRKVSFKEKFGRRLAAVESGDRVGDRVIYFGTFRQK